MPAAPVIKITAHPSKDSRVVNTPGTHIQRRPRVYSSEERARRRACDLRWAHPGASLVVVTP
jgi:hypothetical protein